jgi:hypothetical protein
MRLAPSARRQVLRRDWAHPSHIRTGTGLTPPTSAPGLGMQRDMRLAPLRDGRYCAGTGLTPPTSALGLGSPRPHLRRDWGCNATCGRHLCATAGIAPGRTRRVSAPTRAVGAGPPRHPVHTMGCAPVPPSVHRVCVCVCGRAREEEREGEGEEHIGPVASPWAHFLRPLPCVFTFIGVTVGVTVGLLRATHCHGLTR